MNDRAIRKGTDPVQAGSGERARVRTIVLVVEDDAVLSDSLLTLLEEEGYAAIAVTKLAAAREVIAEKRPSVVLLDLTLEGEFGADLLIDLADDPDAPATVIISAFRLASMIGQRYDVDVIHKPFDVDDVIARIRKAEAARRRPRRPSEF